MRLIAMKPKTTVVMSSIIEQVRAVFPFGMTEEELCADTCTHGCPKKLLEYLDMEITDWEQRLENGEIPNFGDIRKLSGSSEKIHRALVKNHILTLDE